ncbi:hypothetical protein PQG02_25765 [Nostoc sp. UHCC 0926]|uniref:hypothetical protein n=1 Tax=unclassified Nostoc TaxID=2593658 RepID=UPI0023605D4C|nr:hypothetical protein [Nostoc sp. UHCC 0926]WDD32047.1 hypothetical protein PQG02_25765 [Nostoc sp. UHCC 0926]
MFKRKSLISIVIPIAVLLGSCGANFQSVENFSKSREIVGRASNDFAEDIYQSCLRRIKYTPLVLDSGISDRNKRREGCERTERVDSDNFKTVVNILIDYMDALGAIASGKDLSLDNSIDNLGQSIKDLSISGNKLDADAVDGGSEILKVLFDLATKKIRKDALQKAIVCTNEPIHKYVTGNSVPTTDQNGVDLYKPAKGGLIFIVQNNYLNKGGTLGIEAEAINTYYEPYFSTLIKLGDERNQSNYQQVVTQITVGEKLTEDYNKSMEIVSEKEQAARAYNKILFSTVKTHNQLRKEFEEGLKPQDISRLCQFNAKVSFKKIDEKKMKRIQTILNEYVISVKPLVEEVDRAF